MQRSSPQGACRSNCLTFSAINLENDVVKLKAALPAVDGEKIADTIRRALTSAGLDTASSPMLDVNDTIRRALSSAGLLDHDAAALKAPSTTAGANQSHDSFGSSLRRETRPRIHPAPPPGPCRGSS